MVRIFWFAALVLFWCCGTARADSWALPKTEAYLSADQQVRLTVEPRSLKSQLAYFEDKADGKAKAGQRPGDPADQPHALLERRTAGGGWQKVWEHSLVNDVAPVSALVTDSGDYAVTFDNWHSVGFGNDVVVIYDVRSGAVRQMGLDALLPPVYLRALPGSVSSLWWGGEHHFSAHGDRLVLQIAIPSEDLADPQYVEREIDLATGAILPRDDAEWQAALAAAGKVAAARRAAEEAARLMLSTPLAAPVTDDESKWHAYVQEAFFRLDPDWRENYPATEVLRRPDAPDYAKSRGWLHDALREPGHDGSVIMIASPAQANLLQVLEAELRGIAAGALRKVRVYVVADAVYRDRITAAFARSRARLVLIDPAVPIPPRAERIPPAEPPLE